LVASYGTSRVDIDEHWENLDGAFRRFPLGVRKVGKIAESGQALRIDDFVQQSDWFADPDWIRSEGISSFVGLPLVSRVETLGVLACFARQPIGESCIEWLRMIADHLAASIETARALDEIESLKSRLELENEYLRSEVSAANLGDMIGNSAALQAVARQIDLVAPTESSVLILGESGTGKELVARELHRRSGRASRPLIKVNCAAIPRELYESEFFGHSKGAFTGATRDRAGRFELADGGTLFLDEIGEIPLDLQSKLLRVLQEGELERVGEEQTRRVNVRIIAATNRNLRIESLEGRFRQDLYYRLSVFPIELPPLRERFEDVPLLAEFFLRKFARQLGRKRLRLTQANMQQLQQYDWPGNVRELQHVLERACIVSSQGHLQLDLPAATKRPAAMAIQPQATDRQSSAAEILTDAEMRALEAANIQRALAAAGGKIYGSGGAAARLGLKPTTLASRIKSLGIKT
jgi:transcriptional regulator with GAF, ATPase, and Fis domain